MAEALGGSEPRFAQRMTAKALQLGMTNTQFRNASGLPNRGQISTARDIAILAVALRRDFPKYYRYFSEVEFTYRGSTHINHNHMLTRYDGVDGVKTGFIRASGFNIATSAAQRPPLGRRGAGRHVAARATSIMAELLDEGFAIAAQPSVGATARLKLASAVPIAPVTPREMQRRRRKQRPPGLKLGSRRAAAAAGRGSRQGVGRRAVVSAKGWAVQIGALFEAGLGQARRNQGAEARRRAQGPPGHGDPRRGRRRRHELYRARVVGLTQSAARSACDRLKKQKVDCVVVPPPDRRGSNVRHALISGPPSPRRRSCRRRRGPCFAPGCSLTHSV